MQRFGTLNDRTLVSQYALVCNMTAPPSQESSHEQLPSLYRDRSFYGMTITQLLGAFNDNIFKQILLLLLVRVVMEAGGASRDMQWVGQLVFAAPFVLFSGTAGWLSDRFSKRTIIVLSKVGEVVVMAAGMIAFAMMTPQVLAADGNAVTPMLPWFAIGVLLLMGMQSAFFGPSKYGILPEIVRERDLPRFNGWIQMTTFLAIIFGTALAGVLNDLFNNRFTGPLTSLFGAVEAEQISAALNGKLWMAGGVCVVIAIIGTLTSLLVRRQPAAEPGLPFRPSNLAIPGAIWQLLRTDRMLRTSLFAYSLFWFLGGLTIMSVNALGKRQFGLDDSKTSLMPACVGLGIALGCITAGWLSAGKVRLGVVRAGTIGMMVSFTLLAMPGVVYEQLFDAIAPMLGVEGDVSQLPKFGAALLALTAAGFFAGMYAVPLQVLIQIRPPEHEKGRMIGAMNLLTWIAIFFTAPFYGLLDGVFTSIGWPPATMFAVAALLLIPMLWLRALRPSAPTK